MRAVGQLFFVRQKKTALRQCLQDLLKFDQIVIGIEDEEGIDRKLGMSGRCFMDFDLIFEFFVFAKHFLVVLQVQRQAGTLYPGNGRTAIPVLTETKIAIARIEDIEIVGLFLMDRKMKDLVIEVKRLCDVADRQKDDGT